MLLLLMLLALVSSLTCWLKGEGEILVCSSVEIEEKVEYKVTSKTSRREAVVTGARIDCKVKQFSSADDEDDGDDDDDRSSIVPRLVSSDVSRKKRDAPDRTALSIDASLARRLVLFLVAVKIK